MSANSGNQGIPQYPNPVQPPPVVAPGQSSSSGWLKGCLIAAGIVIAVVLVIAAVGGYAVYKKAGPLTAMGMEQGKPEVMAKLTPEVNAEQRAEFEKTYDQMLSEFKSKGFADVIIAHSKSFQLMQTIAADGKITPDEAKSWVDEFNKEEAAPAAKK